jgi:hypothetical protein
MEAEFTDVGLMTGDVTRNPSASCLVMTTEVRLLPRFSPVPRLERPRPQMQPRRRPHAARADRLPLV